VPAPHQAQRPQAAQRKAVFPQALPVASQPDLRAGWQVLRGESELALAKPGRQVSLPTAPLPGQPEAL